MNKTVSLREYARLRGVRLNAVQTALKSGRIHTTKDGKIDVEAANKEWFINTDPAKQRKNDPLFDSQIESMSAGKPNNMATFQQAKTADIYYRAMLAKAKLRMLNGETIDRKRAGMHAFNMGRALRDLFLSFSSRYGALIAAELGTDEHKTVMVIYENVSKLLSESEDLINREL